MFHGPTGFIPYVVAVIGAICFSVVFRTPRRYLPLTVAVGTFSCLAPAFMPKAWHVGFKTFIAALATAALAHLVSRSTRAPAQCFLIPGVIFLVPGTYIYRSFSAALLEDTTTALSLGLAAVTITCGVSFGVLLANWLVPSKKTL